LWSPVPSPGNFCAVWRFFGYFPWWSENAPLCRGQSVSSSLRFSRSPVAWQYLSAPWHVWFWDFRGCPPVLSLQLCYLLARPFLTSVLLQTGPCTDPDAHGHTSLPPFFSFHIYFDLLTYPPLPFFHFLRCLFDMRPLFFSIFLGPHFQGAPPSSRPFSTPPAGVR